MDQRVCNRPAVLVVARGCGGWLAGWLANEPLALGSFQTRNISPKGLLLAAYSPAAPGSFVYVAPDTRMFLSLFFRVVGGGGVVGITTLSSALTHSLDTYARTNGNDNSKGLGRQL